MTDNRPVKPPISLVAILALVIGWPSCILLTFIFIDLFGGWLDKFCTIIIEGGNDNVHTAFNALLALATLIAILFPAGWAVSITHWAIKRR